MKKTLSKTLKNNLFVYSLIAYPLLLFIIFYVIVNFNSIILAFQSIDGTGKHFVGLDNFKLFLSEMFNNSSLVGYSFLNSIKMYAVNLIITTPLSIMFAYVLYKQCVGHKIFSLLGMLPNMMSGLVISLVFFQFIGSSGPLVQLFKTFNINSGEWLNLLYDEKYAFWTTTLYSIWLSFAMSFIMLPTSMRGISSEIFDSAQIDGATNMFQEIWYIILPLIYPTLTTFWITGFSSIFLAAGPLMEFYHTSAPDYVSNMGYYFTKMVLVDATEFSYPKYAAGGIILTLVTAPLTLLLKWALEKFGPTTEG